MSVLIKRVLSLAKKIENFPLSECSPSDDPDMQTGYLYAFRDLTTRFLYSARRVKNKELEELLLRSNFNPEYITDAYTLKAELIGIIDLIEDLKENAATDQINKLNISVQNVTSLLNGICTCLQTESANYLHIICEKYGLKDGSSSEAFKSKWNYVYSRITHLNSTELYQLAKKLEGKYPDQNLDKIIVSIEDYDGKNIISEFENIKELIKNEIASAKFTIWVAVAWFTDKDLANLLYEKHRMGIEVQIILNDDEINSKLLPKLIKYFSVFVVPKSDKFAKLMHHKFCIIDLKKVVHGSYNWTTKAQYNNETITLIEERNTAERFAHEFLEIKKEILNIENKKSSL